MLHASEFKTGEEMTDKVRMITGGTAFGYPVSALRTEARKGNLALIRVANKDWVTEAAIKEMERKCRSIASPPDCISKSPVAGSSLTGISSAARVAAENSCEKLKRLSRRTLPKTTGPTQGNVILLKSGAQT